MLLRYIGLITVRIQGLGGDPGKIPPSFGGAPIPILTGGAHGHGGHGEHHDGRRYTGKIAGLLFDHFGDFVGFELDTGEREHRCDSRERDMRTLAEYAWRERLQVTVVTEPHEPHRIRTVIVREPPATLR